MSNHDPYEYRELLEFGEWLIVRHPWIPWGYYIGATILTCAIFFFLGVEP